MGGCVVPQARHGPQQGARSLGIFGQDPTQSQAPLGLLPGPGTAWELQFKDVITQVLKENQRHNEKKCTNAASSLWKCHNWRTKLCNEFDAMLQAMEVITDAPSS